MAPNPYTKYRALSGYSPAAQSSIRKGLKDGSVKFEPSMTGGEYISGGKGKRMKSVGKKKTAKRKKSVRMENDVKDDYTDAAGNLKGRYKSTDDRGIVSMFSAPSSSDKNPQHTISKFLKVKDTYDSNGGKSYKKRSMKSKSKKHKLDVMGSVRNIFSPKPSSAMGVNRSIAKKLPGTGGFMQHSNDIKTALSYKKKGMKPKHKLGKKHKLIDSWNSAMTPARNAIRSTGQNVGAKIGGALNRVLPRKVSNTLTNVADMKFKKSKKSNGKKR